jgi:hypothetical protein
MLCPNILLSGPILKHLNQITLLYVSEKVPCAYRTTDLLLLLAFTTHLRVLASSF